jgi:8-oxo-dGTP pyrophosphatase MutT (NUDIX family)
METAQREFQEETGLQVRLQHIIGWHSNVSTRFDRISSLTLVYCGEVTGGEMRGSVEGQPCWKDGSDLRSMLDFHYVSLLDDYLEHRKQHQASC